MMLKPVFFLALFLGLFGTSGWSYDALGRLTSVTASLGAFGNVGTFGYSYVGNTSLLAQMTRPNGTKTVLSYENTGTSNALHRLTGVQDVNATGGNIASFGYAYDGTTTANGFVDNRTSQTRSYGTEGAQTISYGYGPTSMLQGEGAAVGGASTPALSKSYVFDAMGNRTSATDAVAKTQTTSTYNALNQLTGQSSYSTSSGAAVGTGSSAFGYDGDGNMNSVTAKDAAGAVTGQTSYSYDDASRLIGIITPGSSKWQFVYDGLSRLRISRSWNWVNGAWVQNSEKRRVYLGMDVVQERDSNNNVTASYTGRRLARSTASGAVFYGFDGRGNVTTLTDGTGAVVGSYTYDAWGNTLASSGAKALENPYRFYGKEQLAGMYSYGLRFYSSGLGRWINRDPIREGGGVNLYCFVGNNPSNKADRYGLDPLTDYEQQRDAEYQQKQKEIESAAQANVGDMMPIEGGGGGGEAWDPFGDAGRAFDGIGDAINNGIDEIVPPDAQGADEPIHVPDDHIIARGGTKPIVKGEPFSGNRGTTEGEAGSRLPHGQMRTATAGDIRAGGGTVVAVPEPDANGELNPDHCDVTVGHTDPFSDLKPNPNKLRKR